MNCEKLFNEEFKLDYYLLYNISPVFNKFNDKFEPIIKNQMDKVMKDYKNIILKDYCSYFCAPQRFALLEEFDKIIAKYDAAYD